MLEFADNPAAYFEHDYRNMNSLFHQETSELQLRSARGRFEQLREHITPLRELSRINNIHAIGSLDDLAYLLIPHGLHKSYAEFMLIHHCFNDLTEWLQHFTTADLSPLLGKHHDSIDGWMEAFELDTSTVLLGSSGTSGRLSLIPRGKIELEIHKELGALQRNDRERDTEADRLNNPRHVVWAGFTRGKSSLLRGAQVMKETVGNKFFPLIDDEISIDWQFHISQLTQARLANRPPPRPSDYVQVRLKRMEEITAQEPQMVDALLDKIEQQLGDRQVQFFGPPLLLHKVAEAGLKRGMASAFGPGSKVMPFGGLKGQTAPDRMEENILRFSGVETFSYHYGMSEMNTAMNICEAGRYHVPPWIIPFLYDAQTGRPLPREGRQRGRVGFMDLVPQTYWGGVIAADVVEMDWGTCACGRHTPSIGQDIQRTQTDDGLDLHLGPTSSRDIAALLAALDK